MEKQYIGDLGAKMSASLQPEGLRRRSIHTDEMAGFAGAAECKEATAKDTLATRIREHRDIAMASTTHAEASLAEADSLEALLRELPDLSPRADSAFRRILARSR